ncbi:MAG: DUF1492 domain-containing protein [Tannerellaceae bacterium]
MTAKEYLLQARYLDMRIKSKIQQIESLNDLATNCSAVISDMPRNPNRGGSPMANAIMKMIDLQDEIKEDMEELVTLKQEITSVIKGIPDLEQQTILEKRYLCNLNWEQIAVDMGYSMQHTFRHHDTALKNIVVPKR